MSSASRYLCPISAIFFLETSLAFGEPHALAPPDTSSPRATFKSYLDIMGEYGRLMRADIHTKTRSSKFRDQQLEDKAELCFDLSQVPRERVDDITNEVLNQLIEVLDRIEMPPLTDIPDAVAVRSDELTRWSIPHTEISIAKVKEGSREGEWLFSPQTVDRLNEFYQRVKHLPYRADAVAGKVGPFGGLYDYYVLHPEETFPSEWIDDLPRWTKNVYLEQPLWKWAGIILVLVTGYRLCISFSDCLLHHGFRIG